MKRILLPVALLLVLVAPEAATACGGMSAILRRMLAAEGIDWRTFATITPPPAAAPPPSAPESSTTSTPTNGPSAPTAPVVVYTPPPPPPPPMVQLSPQDIGGSLRLRSTLVESENEQVTQDLQEGLIIS